MAGWLTPAPMRGLMRKVRGGKHGTVIIPTGEREMQTSLDLAIAEHAFRSGDFPLAERLLKAVLAADPSSSKANELMAYVSGRRGDVEGTGRFLQRATAAADASATSWYYLGVWLREHRRNAEAVAALESALRIGGEFFEALHDLGCALHDSGEPARALRAYERAAALNPASYPLIHNQGRALAALGRYDEALERYDRALALKPDGAESWLNRGESLHDLGRHREALDSYARALAARPRYVDVRPNAALTHLALGEWREGWKEYEYRWKVTAAPARRHARIPAWLGESPLEGKRLLVWCEQGFGDTLQFCRYVPLLAERGATVVLEVQEPLQPLLAVNFDCAVVAVGDGLPPCDLQIPMLSLPLAFGTTPQSVPANVPYVKAPDSKALEWRERVSRPGRKLKVAIACSGRTTYRNESRRQVSLRDFATLREEAHLFLVQKELGDDDRRYLSGEDPGIEYLGEEIRDFRDGAGIVANMDLVVSIDTSLTHLAGAMGKPVWLVQSLVSDWRWLAGRTDSPWYPTLTIFRQRTLGDWKGVMEDVRGALREFRP
jgi:tetratricopeptide (TPR) repeat protein